MVKRGPAIECEMILAFLKAEADSPRFAILPLVSQVLRHATTAGARGSIWQDGSGPEDILYGGVKTVW